MDWAQILVIILGVFLALFLLLGIVLVAMLIRITKQIKSVTSSAERTAGMIEHAVHNIGNVARPLALVNLIKKFIARRQRGKHE